MQSRIKITLLCCRMLPEADKRESSLEGDYTHVHEKVFICSVKRRSYKIYTKIVWSLCMIILIEVKRGV